MNKKEKLLNSAKSLMIEKGFVATTVDDICECAGVTKGSFFYYFKDKEQLAKEAVRSFAENGRQIMFCDSMKKEPDPLKRIFGYLDCLVECAKEKNFKGCLVGSFSQELSETHPEIREICATSFDMFIKSLEKDLAEAKKSSRPKHLSRPSNWRNISLRPCRDP